MDDEVIQYLDRARINLSGSIDKTVRIQQAFLRELEKNYKHSDRVKHIINSVHLIKFHCEIQQKILDQEITDILDSKEKALKKKREERREEKLKRRRRDCVSCELLELWDSD